MKADIEARITNSLNASIQKVNDKRDEIVAAIDSGRQAAEARVKLARENAEQAIKDLYKDMEGGWGHELSDIAEEIKKIVDAFD